MVITTNAENRKELVKALAEHFGERAVYVGPPSFVYTVGRVTVDREAKVIFEDEAMADEVKRVLADSGFTDRAEEGECVETEDTSATLSFPMEDTKPHGIINLINMVHAKQYLINKAVQRKCMEVSDELVNALSENTFEDTKAVTDFIAGHGGCTGIEFDDGKVSFTGFPAEDAMEYAKLVSTMIKTAKAKKRVSSKATIEENEKYYMRTWLVSIGFGGSEGKEIRNFLLKNLNGHTAFRTKADEEKWKEARKAERGSVVCSE